MSPPSVGPMLKYFRGGGVANVLVGGIVSAIIIAFIVEFRAGQGSTGSIKIQCVVDYGGECVDSKDYFAAYGLIGGRVEAAAAKRIGLRKQVLDGLVERTLLVDAAKRLGLGVSEEAIDSELESGRAHVSLPAEKLEETSAYLGLCRLSESRNGCEPGAQRGVRQLRVRRTDTEPFDYKLYEREIRILANRGPKEFKAGQEEELVAARLRDLVRARARVSQAEVEFATERAVIRSVVISRDWFSKYVVNNSRESVEKFAVEHRAQVDSAWDAEKANHTGACPVIREIVLPLSAMALDDEKNPVRKKAEEARARIVMGADFAQVAREVSLGSTAGLGGDVGCLSKSYGLGADELLKALEGLKPGELSQVIDTPRGLHVVQLIERADGARLEVLVRAQIARRLHAQFAADEAATGFARNLIERAKKGQKLEEAVTELTRATLPEAPASKPKGTRKPDEAAAEPAALTAEDRPRFEISSQFVRTSPLLDDAEPKESIAALAFELDKPDAVYDRPIDAKVGFVVFQLKERSLPDAAQAKELRERLEEAKAEDALVRYVADLRSQAGAKLKVDQSFGVDKTSSENE